MEQMNNTLLTMISTSAGQSDLTKNLGKADGGDEFQKLLDKKTNEAMKPETPSNNNTSKPKETTNKSNSDNKTAEKKDGPVQEDAQTTAKRLMQAGLVVVDPSMVQTIQTEAPVMVEEGQELLAQTTLGPGEAVVQTETPMLTQENPGQTMENQLQGDSGEAKTQETEIIQKQPDIQTEKQVENKSQLGQNAQVEGQQTERDSQVEVTDAEQAPQRVFEDVESVPMKVGETYQTEEEPDVAKQIDTQLTQALTKGESHVRIQLTPEHLGTVTVDVSQNSDGILRIAISAHSSETRGLLERHMGNLQLMLANRTQQTVQVEVQRQEESQQGQNQDNPYDGHNGSNREEQEERQRQRNRDHEQAASQDFAQQLRLGLIPEE